MKKKKTVRKRAILLHISVTEQIAKDLKKIAEKQGRTVTELAREAFAKIIHEYECIGKQEDLGE
ncbi:MULTISPECIES: ribbon-helix-helix protein, CopG family [Thermodesulfovibrio]|uniref:ribbon-helix-helix protein, CopG family n=1 Tax=Thermodesulfovibrio TaxID=28261 RepID=UPI001469EE97|nr:MULTISPECIES: ribbon-helix-helix protein, CopG family [Thermodesulfovibrio]